MEAFTLLYTTLIIIAVLGWSLCAFQAVKINKLKKYIADVETELMKLKNTDEAVIEGIADINHQELTKVMFDPLTGLISRQIFEDRLLQTINQSMRLQTSFAVMAIDVDQFKDINKFGYDIGDKFLIELANRLQMSIRQIDTLTRFAGDNFLILLPQLAKPETAAYVAQRIQDNLFQSFKINENEFVATASIGIVIYPIDGDNIHTLLLNAETSLHQAKSHGKNTYQFFQKDIHLLGERELSLSACIRSSDVVNRLIIQYQAYYDVNSSQPYYVQATPFLHHPDLGMITFTKFAKVAENSGKIIEIGEWLLHQAIQQFKKWDTAGFKPKHLAIDVTLRQIENPHFIYLLSDAIKQLNLETTQLVLDITDDNFPVNNVFIDRIFTKINEMGVKIAVGVIALGHFSAQKVGNIPISYLKIDRKLIHSSTVNHNHHEVLNTIIALAKEEKIMVMAEGIDDETKKMLLKELGCDVMEGKIFSHLLPAELEENLSA